MSHLCRFRLLLTLTLLLTTRMVTAAPEVRSVSVRGLQIDGTTTLRVDGTGLLPNPQLVLSIPVAKQTVRPGATATRVEFEVTLAGDIDPGIYNLWIANNTGVSLPTVIATDRLPDKPFAARVEDLPVALHGAVSGSARMRTTFTGKASEAVQIEVEAQRLGGKLRPVLHVFDSSGQQLAWTLPSPTLRGDARLTFTPPKDGEYTVELHDLQYATPAPNHFRLKIGSWESADLVFPPAVHQGQKTALALISDGRESQPVPFDATIARASPFGFAPWANAASAGGFRPPVLISPFPEVVEAKATEVPQKLPAIPSAINGRLLSAGELDRYELAVQTGAKLRFQVFADQIGSPIDAILELQNEKGGRLALNDDAAGSPDSRIDYTVPANVTSLFVVLKDANGRSGPDCIYRIAVTSLTDADPRADFQLRLEQQRQSVASDDRLVVKVIAVRDGYDGPIELRFDTLPDGVTADGTTIAAGSTGTLVTIQGTGGSLGHTLTSLRGVAQIDGQSVERIATVDSHVLARLQPWLSEEIGVSMREPSPSGFTINWGTITPETRIALGGKLDLPVRAVRPPGFDGPVRMTLEMSQAPVRAANNQIDTNRTLRSETNRPIEIAADANAQKAWDATIAGDKALADAKKSLATIAETGRKAVAAADARAKPAITKLNAAKAQATTADAAVKAASQTDASAQQALNQATAQAKSAADTVAKIGDSDTGKLSAAASAAAAAATAAKTAADRKSVTGTKLAVAAQAAKQATAVLTAAETAAAPVLAALKTATEQAAKANADALAKVKDAETKQQTAKNASQAAAKAAKNDGVFSIFVPAQLQNDGYQFAIKAELLSRDKRTVVAQAYTPVTQLKTLIPIVVSATNANALSGEIDPKAGVTISLTGKVERLADMKQDVTVTLSGLPKGIAVPKAVVKPDQTDFKLDIKFPATFKAAELKSIQLFATGKMRPNAPIDVRSKDVPVSIQITEKPVPATGT